MDKKTSALVKALTGCDSLKPGLEQEVVRLVADEIGLAGGLDLDPEGARVYAVSRVVMAEAEAAGEPISFAEGVWRVCRKAG